jgi:signal transduction histidine kinase/ligand-binding sensor domain-containing protein
MQAQHFPVRIYSEADGLANTDIYDIVQDSSGLIWMARRSGISSYNSVNFRNFNSSDGLNGNSFAFLKVDRANKIWAIPDFGLLHVFAYSNGRWQNICKDKPSLIKKSAEFSGFDISGGGDTITIAVATKGLGVFLYSNGIWRNYTVRDGLGSNNIFSICFFNDQLYIATTLGLYYLNKEGKISRSKPSWGIPEKEKVVAMAAAGRKLWMLGEGWLGYFDGMQLRPVSRNIRFFEPRTALRCFLFADDHDRLVFGGPLASFYYSADLGRVISLGSRNGLAATGGLSGMIDQEGNIWVVGRRGISKVMTLSLANYFESDGLATNEVASVIEESPGRMVFGHAGELSFFNGSGFQCLRFAQAEFDENVSSRVIEMKKTVNGIWLAASFCGLGFMDKNHAFRWYGKSDGLEGISYSVDLTPDGTLYTTTSSGLFRKDGDRFVHLTIKGYDYMTIRRVVVSPEGKLLLATLNNGIIEYDKGSVRTIKCFDNPIANNIYSIRIDHKGRCWVGTASGVYMRNDTCLLRVNGHGLNFNRPVYSILEDSKGNMWFGTDNGLIRYDGIRSEHFTLLDGISGLELNRGAGFEDSQGNIWFGTNSGVTVFYENFDHGSDRGPAPRIYIDRIILGKDSLDPSESFSAPGKNLRLDFAFHSVSFKNEKKVRYKYMMEGLDTSWSAEMPYNTTSATYLALPPGKYHFKVKACNPEGVWSSPASSAEIIIQRPLIFRWWFLGMILIAASLIGYLIFKYILVNRYKRNLELMVHERTEELELSREKLRESNQAKDNFFSIIAHDLRSPFNVMLGMLDLLIADWNSYSESEKQSMVKKVMNASLRTIDLLDNLLTWAREQRGLLPFSPEKFEICELLQDNISLVEAGARAKDIDIRMTANATFQVFADRPMVNTIVRNLLSNAVKFTFPGGQIGVEVIRNEAGEIQVSVKDNGFGMSPETVGNLFRIEKRSVRKGTANETGTGLGLILCRDFVERNKGRLWVESEEGEGSVFYFILPEFKEEFPHQ